MIDLLKAGLLRVARFLSGEVPAGEVESPETRIPEGDLSTSLSESPVDLSRWTVTEHIESPFEKVGRVYIDGKNMIIRSDLDSRGFRVPLDNVNALLAGSPQDIRLMKTGKKSGKVQLSTSGKAMNFTIAPFYIPRHCSRWSGC